MSMNTASSLLISLTSVLRPTSSKKEVTLVHCGVPCELLPWRVYPLDNGTILFA